MGFTAAELAEMARADAEIEASFRFTNEEVALSRFLDHEAVLAGMDSSPRERAEAQRRWYEANKEKVSEGKRRWYEANKEKVSEAQRRWYEANKEKVSEAQRRYREANKEKVSEGKRALRALRADLGMSQTEFAGLLGVTQPTICRWEQVKEPENWAELIEKWKDGLHRC